MCDITCTVCNSVNCVKVLIYMIDRKYVFMTVHNAVCMFSVPEMHMMKQMDEGDLP